MTSRPTHRLRSALVASVLALALLGLPGLVSPAGAATETTTRVTPRAMNHNQEIVVSQVNRSRTTRDRRAITTNGLMNQRAMKWAQHLAACQCLEHRAAPYGVPDGWCAAAENVGRSGDGGSLAAVHGAFMASSGHRANILRRGWSDLGVGVAKDGQGEHFVVHVFADYAC
jgi:uncharacterized protein YkwD